MGDFEGRLAETEEVATPHGRRPYIYWHRSFEESEAKALSRSLRSQGVRFFFTGLAGTSEGKALLVAKQDLCKTPTGFRVNPQRLDPDSFSFAEVTPFARSWCSKRPQRRADQCHEYEISDFVYMRVFESSRSQLTFDSLRRNFDRRVKDADGDLTNWEFSELNQHRLIRAEEIIDQLEVVQVMLQSCQEL